MSHPEKTFAVTADRAGPLALLRSQSAMAAIVLAVLVMLAWGVLLWEAARDGVSAQSLWSAICRPVGLTGGWRATLADAGLALGIWSLMSTAMMLPTAAPMLLTYADMAARVRRQGGMAVSVLVVAAGYLSVWIGWSIVAVALQSLLMAWWNMVALPPRVALISAGALVAAAGLYQFSALKIACLEACRHPFADLFSRWTGDTRGVFRLGAREGLNCLGCCWAMMGALVVIGAMNLVWMAIFSILMAIEKLTLGRGPRLGIGIALVLAGVGLGLAGTGSDALVARLTTRL